MHRKKFTISGDRDPTKKPTGIHAFRELGRCEKTWGGKKGPGNNYQKIYKINFKNKINVKIL